MAGALLFAVILLGGVTFIVMNHVQLVRLNRDIRAQLERIRELDALIAKGRK